MGAKAACRSLGEFVARLEAQDKLVRVAEPVSTVLEMTEIQTRLLAAEGPAVLFEKPVLADGSVSDIPVLANLFGTVDRVAMGLGRSADKLGALGEHLASMQNPDPVDGVRDALDKLPIVKSALAMRPRNVRSGPVGQVILKGGDVDLGKLPVQTCWPGEPAPLITWALVVTRGPGEGREDGVNVGVYRMQVLGKNRCIMRWLEHRGGARHHRLWA
ncbi:MAG TPA: UbiD family decarboxylase, partial [Hyphomicrobiales bacterium]|nr:UbiD family decarboxylase [Hyphomicrobiales bacterium]